jgi:pyridoxamine 5'-phosphate oxidase
MNPFKLFNNWYSQELQQSNVRIPSACCLSTIGLDGYPNARFVSLKEVKDEAFIFTGSFATRKGWELDNSNKVALTFWWTTTERQVRIQGDALRIPEPLAEKYFSERNREAQIVSLVSNQGQSIDNPKTLNQKFNDAEVLFKNKPILKPENWGGYSVNPLRIEFLEFKESRFHSRMLFTNINAKWEMQYLQP